MAVFLSLSGELRNKVYRRCFVNEMKTMNLQAHTIRSNIGDNKQPASMPICKLAAVPENQASAQFLACCRQIHDEGLSILYGENVFCVEPQSYHIPGQVLGMFAQTIGSRARAYIQYLHLVPDFRSFHRWERKWEFLDQFINLKGLLIRMSWRSFRDGPLPPSLHHGIKILENHSSDFLTRTIPRVSRELLYNDFSKINSGQGVFTCYDHVGRDTTRRETYRVTLNDQSESGDSSLSGENFKLVFVSSWIVARKNEYRVKYYLSHQPSTALSSKSTFQQALGLMNGYLNRQIAVISQLRKHECIQFTMSTFGPSPGAISLANPAANPAENLAAKPAASRAATSAAAPSRLARWECFRGPPEFHIFSSTSSSSIPAQLARSATSSTKSVIQFAESIACGI
ncbi:hypothetical protein FKW77_007204 [Venturia effusa]|uniref:Uncharacterized protein n=1 Tax=Venturia effusa TaxID=50376 RepID=A0A517LN43_9PEZI|nr:hypothetical protein FKW77_007204 [Venturia effusa]